MNGFTKKSLVLCCAVALIASLSCTYALGVVTIDLGNITVHMPAHVVIASAFIGDVNGTVSANGQSVVFNNLPDMVVGDKKALTLTLINDGGLDANVSSIAIAGLADVLVFNSTSGAVPCVIGSQASSLFTWSINAVGSGTVHPVVSLTWA